MWANKYYTYPIMKKSGAVKFLSSLGSKAVLEMTTMLSVDMTTMTTASIGPLASPPRTDWPDLSAEVGSFEVPVRYQLTPLLVFNSSSFHRFLFGRDVSLIDQV
jgi:hypothetical protein